MKKDKGIFWCKTCLNMSTRNRIEFDDKGRCNACVWSEEKKNIDWSAREEELKKILSKHKSNSKFDIIVPVSGGKDGSYVAYQLKHKYGLTPLCVTITPPLAFSLGSENLENFIKNSGMDTVQINPNYEIMRELNKRGFINQGRPLYGWTTAIFTAVMKVAKSYGINLVMYGEDGEIEYGGSTESKYKPIFSAEFLKRVYLEGQVDATFSGYSDKELFYWKFDESEDLSNIELSHWSYFENWDPYRNYLVAKEHMGLKEKQETNTGTFTNFSQNDNCIYDLHTYLMYLKFGFGRGTQDAGIDIRRGAMSREQGKLLAEMYDSAPPTPYVDMYLEYFQMTKEQYESVIDKWANKDLFVKMGDDTWKPRFKID
jgi:N-acetyl sugar amidotransferase